VTVGAETDSATGVAAGADGDGGVEVIGATGVTWTAVEPVREQPATSTAPSATINTALRIAPDRGFMSLGLPHRRTCWGT
jgi:hypothetical protein